MFARSGEAGAKDDNGNGILKFTIPNTAGGAGNANNFAFLFVRPWAKGVAEENVKR